MPTLVSNKLRYFTEELFCHKLFTVHLALICSLFLVFSGAADVYVHNVINRL